MENKQMHFRRNQGGGFSGTKRFKDSKNDATNGLDNEYIGIREVAESKEKIDTNDSQQNRRRGTSKSNFKEPSSLSIVYNRFNEPFRGNTNIDRTIGVGSTDHIPHMDLQGQEQQEIRSINDAIIAGMLIALIVVFVITFVFLVYQPVLRYLRRNFGKVVSENQTLVERRYKTIDKWLIQKVNIVQCNIICMAP